MKKYILSVICLLAMSASSLFAGGPSFSQYYDINSYGVDVSTVQFSTRPVLAFIGPGIVYGVNSSSVSNQQYYDLFDTTFTPISPAQNDPNYKMRINASTNTTGGVDYQRPLLKPVRFYKGCWWQQGEAATNISNLYYIELRP
jgi:hypothetical protein